MKIVCLSHRGQQDAMQVCCASARCGSWAGVTMTTERFSSAWWHSICQPLLNHHRSLLLNKEVTARKAKKPQLARLVVVRSRFAFDHRRAESWTTHPRHHRTAANYCQGPRKCYDVLQALCGGFLVRPKRLGRRPSILLYRSTRQMVWRDPDTHERTTQYESLGSARPAAGPGSSYGPTPTPSRNTSVGGSVGSRSGQQ
jgi:hypothetical protein